MSAVTASLCSTLMFVLFVSADQKTITAQSGQDVTLTCRAPNNNIIFVEWSRADLVDEYVLLYHHDHFDSSNQHPSFKNRVDLQDRQMKDGDVSLILKDVTINDAETYLCRVYMEETRSWELINSTYLIVDPLDKKTIPAESGQNITLPCRAPNKNITIIVVKWTKPVLKPELVLLYRDKGLNPHNQHPSFKNRVDLQDRQMKDGDVSLILKNVTINDAGTYACRVFVEETRSWAFRRFIYLTVVDPPGHTGGYPVWKIGLIACVVLLGGAVIFLIFRKIYKEIQKWRIKRHKQDQRSAMFSKLTSDSPPAVPRSHNTTRRKTGNQGQKETDDAAL